MGTGAVSSFLLAFGILLFILGHLNTHGGAYCDLLSCVLLTLMGDLPFLTERRGKWAG